jgi:hypothetical protein
MDWDEAKERGVTEDDVDAMVTVTVCGTVKENEDVSIPLASVSGRLWLDKVPVSWTTMLAVSDVATLPLVSTGNPGDSGKH